jgi:YfiH family protein
MEARRVQGPDGGELPLLVSPIIPSSFRHGFTTRTGGVSLPPFDSLNFGWRWGDAGEHVAENHRRLLAVSGAAVLCRTLQVHGTRILRVGGAADPAALVTEEADGLSTSEPGLALSVHVADCTPIIMASGRTGGCAALHAGWRGTVAGMARAGVRHMVAELGCDPAELRVALGPCIGACCFEVGPEVVAAFLAAMPDAEHNGVLLAAPGRRPRVDLRRFQCLQLKAEGVPSENIDASTDCTHCDPSRRFFSYRRAGRATGQMVGFVTRIA